MYISYMFLFSQSLSYPLCNLAVSIFQQVGVFARIREVPLTRGKFSKGKSCFVI